MCAYADYNTTDLGGYNDRQTLYAMTLCAGSRKNITMYHSTVDTAGELLSSF